MNDSLAFADRLLDYLKASNIIAAYLLRRGRHLEGSVFCSNPFGYPMLRVNFSVITIIQGPLDWPWLVDYTTYIHQPFLPIYKSPQLSLPMRWPF